MPGNFDYATCGFSYVDGNYGGTNDGVDESWGPRLDGTPRSQYSTTVAGGAEVRPWVAHPNNVSSFFQTGHTITSNIAAQGANDRSSFRLSVTRQDVAGLVPGALWSVDPGAANVAADAGRRAGHWGGYDITRLREEFGWAPLPLEARLAEYIDWLGDCLRTAALLHSVIPGEPRSGEGRGSMGQSIAL